MKRILVIIALCSPLLMQAQSIEHILKSIEQNNKRAQGTETCRRCDQDGKPDKQQLA